MEKNRILFGVRKMASVSDSKSAKQELSEHISTTVEEEEVEEIIKKQHWTDKLIIRENSKKKATFDIFINILVGYSCFTTIYQVSFDSIDNKYVYIFDLFTEFMFAFDIVFNFLMEYKDQETYETIK